MLIIVNFRMKLSNGKLKIRDLCVRHGEEIKLMAGTDRNHANNQYTVRVCVFVCVFIVQGREGEIRHLFRGFAFLHCKKLVENGGMFVCKTRHLVLAGGSKVSAALAAL